MIGTPLSRVYHTIVRVQRCVGPTTIASWKRAACRIANRNLTQQEWRQYFGDLPYHKTCPALPTGP